MDEPDGLAIAGKRGTAQGAPRAVRARTSRWFSARGLPDCAVFRNRRLVNGSSPRRPRFRHPPQSMPNTLAPLETRPLSPDPPAFAVLACVCVGALVYRATLDTQLSLQQHAAAQRLDFAAQSLESLLHRNEGAARPAGAGRWPGPRAARFPAGQPGDRQCLPGAGGRPGRCGGGLPDGCRRPDGGGQQLAPAEQLRGAELPVPPLLRGGDAGADGALLRRGRDHGQARIFHRGTPAGRCARPGCRGRQDFARRLRGPRSPRAAIPSCWPTAMASCS